MNFQTKSSISRSMKINNKKSNSFIIKKGDVIVVILLIIISLLPSIVFSQNVSGSEEKYVEIYVDGEKFKEIKLGEDIHYEYEIISDNGQNIVVISGDEVYMESADCFDQSCVKQGKISDIGRSLVCLPNRIFIEIVGKEASEIDDISR